MAVRSVRPVRAVRSMECQMAVRSVRPVRAVRSMEVCSLIVQSLWVHSFEVHYIACMQHTTWIK